MAIYTERSQCMMETAKLPESVKAFNVPDDHSIFDKTQKDIIANYKKAFGAEEATSTLKIVIDKQGERQIYEPSVIAKDGKPVIEWGGKYFPVTSDMSFAAGRCLLTAELDDVEYSIKVRVIPIDKAKAVGKVQMDWATCSKDDKADMLAKLWKKGTIVEIMASAFPTVLKLGEVIGSHDVVGYKLNNFGKYELRLSDGRWVRSNTALHNKLEGYEQMGVTVSPEAPARLTVGESTSNTTTGHPIYPVTLVSHRNLDLPVFDFGSDFPAVEPDKEEVDVVHF